MLEKYLNKIICGDCLKVMKEMPDNFIDMVMFSPPYYGLRNYGIEGQWGLEKTFDEYLDKMITVMKEVKRVLKKTGTIWVNFGDCYGAGQRKTNVEDSLRSKRGLPRGVIPKNHRNQGFEKCLLMQPERFAIRCIDELGLILRNKIKWAKQVLIFEKDKKYTKGSVMPTCLSPETEVYIKNENGVIAPHKLKELLDWNLENIKILTPTGWKKIKNVWKVKKDKVIKFKVGSSSEIECSLQHKFPISHDNRRKRYEIKEAQELRMSKNKMLDRFLFVPIKNFLPDNTKIELNYKLGKFIGLYAAEGGFVDYSKFKSYQGKFTLNKKETKLANDIKWGLKHFGVKYKENFIKNYRSIVFNSRDIKNFVSRFVLGKCKEKRLDMVAVLNTNQKFRQGLFNGIIAGDGHKDKNSRITFGSASKQLRDDLYLLASSIGLLASKHEDHRLDKRTNKIYSVYYLTIPKSLQKEKICGEREFERGNPLSAKYKNEFKAKTLKFSNPKIIKENKYLIDLEVEDGLFLINGGIVSHNSVKDRFNESGEELYFFVKSKKYWCDLNAVRLPPQTFENRPDVIIREREWYPEAKMNKFAFNYRVRDAVKKAGQPQFRASEEEIKKYKQNPDPRGNQEGGPGSYRLWKDKHPYQGKFAGRQDAEMFNSPRARNTRIPKKEQQYKTRDPERTESLIGKNIPTVHLIEEKRSGFIPFSFEKHTAILTVKEFENLKNIVSLIENQLINVSLGMESGLDISTDNRIETVSNTIEEFFRSRKIQPYLTLFRGSPYATIAIKNAPNEVGVIFGRNVWIFGCEGFTINDAPLSEREYKWFAININPVISTALNLFNWISGFQLTSDYFKQLPIFGSKTELGTLLGDITISEKQSQEISGGMSEFAKIMLVKSVLANVGEVCRIAIAEKSMIMRPTKATSNSSFLAKGTNKVNSGSCHILNLSDFLEKGNRFPACWQINPEPHNFQKELGVESEHFACVDEVTECLTLEGWKRYSELRRGEKIASYNLKKKIIEYQPLNYLKIYNFNGELIKVGKRDLDILMTLNHRNIVKKRNNKEEIVLAENLKKFDKIRVLAPIDYPDNEGIGKNLAELLGWIISEGYFRKDVSAISIYQKEGQKSKRIETLLGKLEIPFTKGVRQRKGKMEVEFYLVSGKWTNFIRSLIPDKKLNKFLVSLPIEECNALFKGLIGGDGHIRKDDGRVSFIQKDKECQNWFQILAMRLGYHSINSGKNTFLTRRKYIGIREANNKTWIKYKKYKGKIWCPQTKNGTWVARRNGRIFITGNTYPEALCEIPIKFGCPEGGIVLDPFCGSGTTCVAAKKLNRNFIGIDISPEYCKIAEARIKTIQPNLFTSFSKAD